ncbi:serine protease family S33 [Achlya hypogyna]|uniref:Serine protease family S33 n=1 Tax=Achlya hypogyna TaxID=1202772 RepID=A0A1V9YN33_ACHHY|nr:serine protease family S33 [Achlya hypogyna]
MLQRVTATLAVIAACEGANYSINGWYSCSLSSDYTPSSSAVGSAAARAFHEPRPRTPWSRRLDFKVDALDQYFAASEKEPPSKSIVAECAAVQVPLCHAGICSNPRTIPAFVKRIPASSGLGKKKALWVLQGGPGASSVNMEGLMANLHALLDGQFSVYTMDHRGTGRSLLLDCEASQATAAGSPGGASVTADELPSCLADINYQFGTDASMFSVSSAAADLAHVLANDPALAAADVFVYGVSYGTYVVERLMHLAPHNVKGYVLDSVQAESFPADTTLAGFYSNWDRDFGEVASAFFALCDADAFCAAQIGPNSRATVMNLYAALDANATQCAQLIATDEPPSWTLRKYFAALFTDMEQRLLIPALVKRFVRCDADDLQVLSATLGRAAPTEPSPVSYVRGSDLLYSTIVFSEIWQPRTDAQLRALFEAEPIASGLYDGITATYCLTTGSAVASVCTGQPRTKGFKYTPPDGVWNVTAAVPANASVLVLAGALDPQTPAKYARLQFEAMTGVHKRLVVFPFAAHGVINSTPMTTPGSLPCAYAVLASYVRTGGDVDGVDVSCEADVAPLRFEVSRAAAQAGLFTDDAFDGPLNSALSDAPTKAMTTQTSSPSQVPLIIVSALFGLSMLVVLALGLALRRQQSRAKEPPYKSATGLVP